MNFKDFLKEVKNRNLVKSALAYLAIAWILLQVFSILLPLAEAPIWILKALTLVMLIGFPFWLLFSWKYQITAEGLKKLEPDSSFFSTKFNLIIALIFLIILVPTVIYVLKQENGSTIDEKITDPITEMPDAKDENLSSNFTALDFYFKGNLHLMKQSQEDIDIAIENYEKAIQQDSLFAMAYNKLASAYMRKNLSFDPNIKWEEEAYAAAGKAIQLDSKLANPHIIQGQFYWSPTHNFAHEAAIKEFEKAIFKDSLNSEAYEQLSLVQLHIGLFDKAMNNAKKSLRLDPSNYRARRFIGEIFLFQGKYAEALKEFNKIPDSFAPQPTRAFLALTYFYMEKHQEVIELLEDNLSTFPKSPHLNSVYAIILASKGKKDKSQIKLELAQENIVDLIHAHHVYFYLGMANSLLGENEKAIVWLQNASDSGFPNYPLYSSDPVLKGLDKEIEFLQLLQNLKEDWEYYKGI